MALYFYFNETTGDLVYSDKATYGGSGYTSLGQQEKMWPLSASDWVFHSKRASIKTVTKDPSLSARVNVLTSMNSMFYNCSGLTSIDLSSFDTSVVTDMSTMFHNCSGLTSIDLSSFDTSAVTVMGNMFYGCSGLTSLDLSNFNTSAVTGMSNMFYGCSGLTSLDLSSFNTSAVTDISNMFYRCFGLRLITISDKMSNALSELPSNSYYPAAGGEPVAKTGLTAGTWVRDEADLTKVTSLVEQAQMSQAISRRIGSVRRDLEARIDGLTQRVAELTKTVDTLVTKVVTKSPSDPAFTAADLATYKMSAEGVPYREE